MGQGIYAIELRGEAFGGPDRDAQAPIAHRHGFRRKTVWPGQNDVGPAYDACGVDHEMSGLPCGRGSDLCGDTVR